MKFNNKFLQNLAYGILIFLICFVIIYTLNYKAKLIGEIDIESIVTAADYSDEMKLLVLTSTFDFNEYFIITIENFDPSKLNNKNINKLKIPIGKTQVESIKIINKSSFWITSEAELLGKPKLYKISL